LRWYGTTKFNRGIQILLNVIETLVSSEFAIEITYHSRDIMDNLKGHLYGYLNKNKRYDQSTLKYDSPFINIKAIKLKEKSSKNYFIKKNHVEHAKPLKFLIKEIKGLKGRDLLDYILGNVKASQF